MGHLFRIKFQYLPTTEQAVCSRASRRRPGASRGVRCGGQIFWRCPAAAMRGRLRDLAARHLAVQLHEARATIASARAASLAMDRAASTLPRSVEAAPHRCDGNGAGPETPPPAPANGGLPNVTGAEGCEPMYCEYARQ